MQLVHTALFSHTLEKLAAVAFFFLNFSNFDSRCRRQLHDIYGCPMDQMLQFLPSGFFYVSNMDDDITCRPTEINKGRIYIVSSFH